MVLITDRLRLAPPTDVDTAFIASLLGDDEVRRFLGGVIAKDQRAAAVSRYSDAPPGEAHWVAHSQTAIGLLSVTAHKDGSAHELSYMFAPHHWGQGFAYEAAQAVLQDARTRLGHDHLIAETQAANERSCRLLMRLGMVEEQRLMRFGAEQIIFRSTLPTV